MTIKRVSQSPRAATLEKDTFWYQITDSSEREFQVVDLLGERIWEGIEKRSDRTHLFLDFDRVLSSLLSFFTRDYLLQLQSAGGSNCQGSS